MLTILYTTQKVVNCFVYYLKNCKLCIIVLYNIIWVSYSTKKKQNLQKNN